jgi:recombinational DNA repair protein RecR
MNDETLTQLGATLIWLGDAFLIAGFALIAALFAFHLILNRTNKHLQQKLDELEEQVKNRMICLDVESQNGQYFCYDSDTNQFICQGFTIEEIISSFRKRFPGKEAVLSGNADDPIMRELIRQLKELKQNDTSA